MNDIPQTNSIIPKSTAPVIKLFIIGFIILVLMIPVAWISSLIHERYERRDSVTSEIASKWGAEQIITGPFISVPYQVKVIGKDENGIDKSHIHTRYLNFTPSQTNITGKITSVMQHRGIFKVTGYKAELDINSALPALADSNDIAGKYELDWNNALITFDLVDERGLKELKGNLNGEELTFNKSDEITKITSDIGKAVTSQGGFLSAKAKESTRDIGFKFAAKVNGDISKKANNLTLHLNMSGTQQLSFVASALNETIDLKSDWASPSFTGSVLPDAKKINANGFTATWHTNYLNTGNKPYWSSIEPNLRLAGMGVDFLIMVDSYQQTTRALKYSILFLLLTFMTFFLTETIMKQRIHPIQYLMVGCSLVIFYLLLLSISEHLSFGWSYLIAAFGVVMQISLYCYSILKTRKFALQVGAIVTAVYAFLYVLLRLEDSALLVGSISLFAVLGITMYVIRNINWFGQE